MLIEAPWLFVGGGAALVGTIVLIVQAAERRRREAYEQHCLVRGFRFERERAGGEHRFRDIFDPFNQGRSRRWGYTISGQLRGVPFTAFEYRWVTGGGKSSTTHCLAGMVWEAGEAAPFPKFALTPEGWFTRLGEFFGMQDIDFEDTPDFSRTYRLKGSDEAAIRSLFSPEVRHFFGVTPDQRVAGGGRFLFWWKDERLPTVDHLDEWLEAGDHVRRRFFKS